MRSYKQYEKVMNIVSLIFGMMGTMVLVWMVASTINVAANNFSSPENIGSWNMFKISCTLKD